MAISWNFAHFQSVQRMHEFVDHDSSKPAVAKPGRDMQCWALVMSGKRWRRCEMRCRGAGSRTPKCTCSSHGKLETAAQALRVSLGGGDSALVTDRAAEQRRRIHELRAQGKTLLEIADAVNVSRFTVARILKVKVEEP